MKRANISLLFLASLFLIVFNLLFFILGDESDAKTSVWISYGFIHFAYILLLLTPLFVRKGSVKTNYCRPLYMVTSIYFIVELFVGITLILIAPETAKVTISIQVVLAASFLGWLLMHIIANEHTANSVEHKEQELEYMKESSARLQSVIQLITDSEIAQKIERVYDLLHSSPTKSNTDVHLLEQKIISEIKRLEIIVNQNDTKQIATIADKIYRLVDERNSQLKISNR